MNPIFSKLWGKTFPNNKPNYHPIILHSLDVIASFDIFLELEPQSTRDMISKALGLPWDEAKKWLLIVYGCHDIGKISPAFQLKGEVLLKYPNIKNMLDDSGLKIYKNPRTEVSHAHISQHLLEKFLPEKGLKRIMGFHLASIIGSHHGNCASDIEIKNIPEEAKGNNSWFDVQKEFFNELFNLFSPKQTPIKEKLSGIEFKILQGILTNADWLGSNPDFFIAKNLNEYSSLNEWYQYSLEIAKNQLNAIGKSEHQTLTKEYKSFKELFNEFEPRPLQIKIEEIIKNIKNPCVILVEAPMGEGKTEAAEYACSELERKFGHRGAYLALPTKATSNAMFDRFCAFLKEHSNGQNIDIQLAHGATQLNTHFEKLKYNSIYNEDFEGGLIACSWFAQNKKSLLSKYGVGTIDQILLGILSVRHNFIRLWGIYNKVVIFDEVHAYDAYTGSLLKHILNWLIEMGCSVIILSATLPRSFRKDIANIINKVLPESEAPYPRISVFDKLSKEPILQETFETDALRKNRIRICELGTSIKDIKNILAYNFKKGMGVAIVNTVSRAQKLYKKFGDGEKIINNDVIIGKRLQNGTEIYLFHARDRADFRQIREDFIVKEFGKKGNRIGKKILIATQVVEQSLDLDFDIMITDLAPIDLILQRAGRLWRHYCFNNKRNEKEPILYIAGLKESEDNKHQPPNFDQDFKSEEKLYWGLIYGHSLLIKTWLILKNKQYIDLPEDIDMLVSTVYDSDEINTENLSNEFVSSYRNYLKEDNEKISNKKQKANTAIIGQPQDSSWDNTSRITKTDPDDSENSESIAFAQTRLGEMSVTIVPIYHGEKISESPNKKEQKEFANRAISVINKKITGILFNQKDLIPNSWKKTVLLRNYYPLYLDENNMWQKNKGVEMNAELGLVIGE